MQKSAGRVIAVRTESGGQARKLAKVIGYGAGGFAVTMPYHSARSGFVAKVPIDYNVIGRFEVPAESLVGFTAENRTKLSYHPDGFVQFSGEIQGKVISGRDPKTGEPRGVGLMTQPLSNPIRTGPTFGVVAWGLEDFGELRDADRAVVFEPEDMYYRGCTPEEANGLLLEVFVFPKRYWAATRQRRTGYALTMAFRFFEASYAAIELKVLDLPGQDILLAGFVSRLAVSFRGRSGWVLNGPGNREKSGKGHVLMAFYPRDAARFPPSSSLDRPPPGRNSKGPA
jgi:hypothetical protein